MHVRLYCLVGLVALLLSGSAAAGQTLPPAAPAASKTVEVLEDLRILSILNTLQPTREQLTRLIAVAETGGDGIAAIDTEAKAPLNRQREVLLAAREELLHGGRASAADAQIASAGQAAEAGRAQKTEGLITTMAQRVQTILTPEQARRIESELAPTGDQPWRLYSRGITGPSASKAGSARLPSDPGTWLKELRNLRAQAAAGDVPAEVQSFTRKVTRGLRSGTPLFDKVATEARALAGQALSLPPTAFNQREWSLARAAAKMELDARNQQRLADGKPAESFDASRWLVEQVLLSPRAVANLRDRAKTP